MRRRWILIFLYFTYDTRTYRQCEATTRKVERGIFRDFCIEKKNSKIYAYPPHTAYCANTHTRTHSHTHAHTHTNMSRMSPALRVPEDDSIVRNIVTAIEQEFDLEGDATTSKAKSFSKKRSAKRGPLTKLENHLVDANEKELPATR